MQFDEAKAVSCLHEKPLEDSLNYRAQPARQSDACVAAVTRMAIPRERIGCSIARSDACVAAVTRMAIPRERIGCSIARSDACVAAVTRMAIPRARTGRSLSSIIREWSYPRSFPNVMY